MAKITALNYADLGIKGKNQLGTDEKVNNKHKNDLKDGLSAKELEKIDKNGDGILTEAEFKKAFKQKYGSAKGYETYWNTYTEYYDSSVKNKKDGTSKVTQTAKDGTTIVTTFDSDGNVLKTKKTDKKENENISKFNNSQLVKTNNIAQDGSEAVYGSHGELKKFIPKGNETKEVAIKYSSNGNIESVRIGDNVYKNIKITKDGKVIVKDKNGKKVMTYNIDNKGNTAITLYNKKGKKTEKYKIDQDGNPVWTMKYDKNGYPKKKTFCQTGRYRTYEVGKNGKLKKSTDYAKDGTKLTEQTYKTNNGSKIYSGHKGSLWASRTYFNEDGSVKKYEVYSYKKQKDGTVIKTVKVYSDESKSNLISTTKYTQDKYGNTISSEEVKNDEKSTTSNDKSKETSTATQTNTTTQTNTAATSEQAQQAALNPPENPTVPQPTVTNNSVLDMPSSDGVKRTFHANGQVASEEFTDDKGTKYVIHYDENGKKISEVLKNNHGQDAQVTTFDENGNIKDITVNEYDPDFPTVKTAQAVYDADHNLKSSSFLLSTILKNMFPDTKDNELPLVLEAVMDYNNISEFQTLYEYTLDSGVLDGIKLPEYLQNRLIETSSDS